MALGNSAGINFSGLSSGLDTEGIITQLSALERRPILRLQQQQARLQTQKAAYEAFRNALVGLNQAVSGFNSSTAFNVMKATSSNSELVSITATGEASQGIREIGVTRLATAERLSSSAQTSSTAALGFTGAFKINDVAVNVTATDTLQTLASKINSAGAGATASLVDGGTGRAYLTLTSSKTGAEHALRLEDLNVTGPISAREGVLAKLGLETLAAHNTPLPGVISQEYASDTQSLNDLMGISLGVEELKVNGHTVIVDYATDNLTTLAAKINAVPGTDARVVASNGGFQLEINGDVAPVLEGLDAFGMTTTTVPTNFAAQNPTRLVEAQDAQYTLDGIALTSASNTITSVIPGATITLNSADPVRRATLAVTRDTDTVMGTVKGLMTAFNRVNSFIRDNSTFDSESYETGILFGDSVAAQVSSALNNTLFSAAQGVTGAFRNLTQIGFSLDSNGNVAVDDAALRNALETNPNAVADLLRSTGSSASSSLTYVSASNKTKASPSGGYAVNVTQLATQTKLTAAAAQTGPLGAEEVVSFSGGQFGANGVALVIPAGSTQQEVIAKINSDSRLKDFVSASSVDGKLVISSKRYGAASDFTVASSAAAGPTTTGIGTTGQAVKVTGVDVQGTINGEPTIGSGRFLLGSVGNANTEGLQIEYTGSTLGAVGTVQVSKGLGSMMFDSLDTFINFQNGLFVNTNKSLDDQISDIESRIDRINTRASSKAVELRARFAAMEAAMARSQQQLAQLQQSLRQ